MTRKANDTEVRRVIAAYDRRIDAEMKRLARTNEPMPELGGTSFTERGPCGVGFLTMIASKEDGEIVQIEHGRNLVLNQGRSAMAHLVGILGDGGAATSRYVDRMRFGDSDLPTDVTQTNIQGAEIITKTPTVDFPDLVLDLKVRFTVTIGLNEGNLLGGGPGAGTITYKEALLVCQNGDGFSRKLTGNLTKNETIILTAVWTIIY